MRKLAVFPLESGLLAFISFGGCVYPGFRELTGVVGLSGDEPRM